MKLTDEQIAIVNSNGDIKINAVAGSGKTSTLIAYAKARQDCKILYLVFNKSAKMEALKKFRNLNLDHVKIETAHSLAYRHIVSKTSYTIKNQVYKLSEIVQLLNIKSNNNKRVLEFVMASHINKFLTYYCNSDKENIVDLNYLDIVEGNEAITFVSQYYDYILHQTGLFIDKMNKAEIELTHDFYLKKFQLSQPNLKYDYILFDEGQDASPAMLSIFLKQKATKVIVGDVHQQIYSWRHAINALESIHFQTFQLNTSFRFNQNIADLASEVLKFKDNTNISIIGKGGNIYGYSKAIIARTNAGLLQHAFDYITQNIETRYVHFEGNFNSYAFTEDGASLYDILNLYKGQKHLIKDPIIKSMKDMYALIEFVNKTNDTQLKMLTSIVNKHNTNIPFIINMIKNKHVDNHERYKADIIFSTTHRCKGLEYDTVYLANDFIKLNELVINETPNAQIIEEINILYVAITRAKNKVFLPESISEYCTS